MWRAPGASRLAAAAKVTTLDKWVIRGAIFTVPHCNPGITLRAGPLTVFCYATFWSIVLMAPFFGAPLSTSARGCYFSSRCFRKNI